MQDILDFWKDNQKATEIVEASQTDFQSLHTFKEMGRQRGGNFLTQAVLCHNRSLVQQFRLIPAFVLEIAVALLAGNLFRNALIANIKIINQAR